MDMASVALVVAALGVSFGWQPSPDDPQAYEVLMQVEPELIDVIADGRQIPIESHVPADIKPIRNIRLVVGTNELPRQSIAASKPSKSSELIVRGQEPSPITHTANFQADDGWSGDRYAPAATDTRQFDQRGATIGSDPIRTAQNNPWTIDNAQKAATDAGNSLRNSVTNSVNSTMDSTGQQLNNSAQQFMNSAQQAGNEFGQQLQEMTGFGVSLQPPSATAPSGQNAWPAAPQLTNPTASTSSTPRMLLPPGATGTTPHTAWSDIVPQLAPPPLQTPPIPGVTRMAQNTVNTRANGPNFPAPPPVNDSTTRSVLTNPSAPPVKNSAASMFDDPWTTNSQSNTSGGAGLVPVAPRTFTNTSTTAAPPVTTPAYSEDPRWQWPARNTNATSAPVLTSDRVTTQQNNTPQNGPSNSAADLWAQFGSNQGAGNDQGQLPANPVSAPGPSPQNHANMPQSPLASAQREIGTEQPLPNPNQLTSQQPAVPNDGIQWKPLLAVSLALAGSLGANLFLGWSYAEARHRYLALAAKTTRSFQKAAGLAA